MAKDRLDVWVRETETVESVPHNEAGIEALCERLIAQAPDRIVVEATGGREVPLAAALQAVGLPVAVAINPLTGPLWWEWQAHRKSTERARIWGARAEEPGLDGWVWDGAGGHKRGDVQAIAAPQVVQPPYAPELNPVARFFQELRRALGDRVHPTLEAKQAALEPILRAWQADPARVRQLCGWGWIRDALTALADDTQATQS